MDKIENNFKFYRRFYNQKVLKSIENDNFILLEEYNFDEEAKIKNELNHLKKKLVLKNNNLCEILKFTDFKIEDSVKNIFNLKIFYEFSELNLKEKLKIYKKRKIKFSLEELFHLIFDWINVLTYLQTNYKIHGDLRPEYIIIKDNNINKWINRLINKDKFPNNLIKIFKKKVDNFYFPPEIYNKIVNNVKIPHYNFYKIETFSLGLIILEAAYGKSIQKLYKPDKFDLQLLLKIKIKVNLKYENIWLEKIIDILLEQDINKRLDYVNLKSVLPSYKEIKLMFNLEKHNQLSYVSKTPLISNNKNNPSFIKPNTSLIKSNTSLIKSNTPLIKSNTWTKSPFTNSKVNINKFMNYNTNVNPAKNLNTSSSQFFPKNKPKIINLERNTSSIFLQKKNLNNNKKIIFDTILERRIFLNK